MSDFNKEMVQDIYNAQEQLKHQISDLGTQVERIKRVSNFDTKSEAVHNLQNETVILKSIEGLTATTAGIVSTLQEEKADQNNFYRARRREKQTTTMRSLRYNRLLTQLDQNISDEPCPCGKHRALQFLSPEGAVIDEMCPKTWWVKRSRIAFENGTLSSFVENTPIGDYVGRFNLTAV